jgi:hypothetical protein
MNITQFRNTENERKYGSKNCKTQQMALTCKNLNITPFQ